jgi:XTP/dITP diphosphohydrolase
MKEAHLGRGPESVRQNDYQVKKKLLIGTGNGGKYREIEQLLSELPLELLNLTDFELTEVEETGATYLENATLKAIAYAKATSLWTLAEDSGLEVAELNGSPGIYSARHAGESASSSERNKKVLSDLRKLHYADRTARFVCIAVVASPEGQIVHSTEGVCIGSIATTSRGTNGFGYDSIFIPKGFTRTFGELPVAIKQKLSHRAKATAQMKQFLTSIFDLKQSKL